MIYYYANTGHKLGLERLRRGVALLNTLTSHGEETQLLVNDFRAGLVARDLGVDSYVTIETVQDIDAIAEVGNSIIIDSVEKDQGRLVKFCADFENVWRFALDDNDTALHSEIVIDKNTIFVDDRYFENKPKVEKILFFLGDADYDKVILNNAAFFNSFDMELLLGNYFFVKYEDDLAKLFSTLHEPEAHEDLITTSNTIVTASMQTALEAKASGAYVIYLHILKDTMYDLSFIESKGITIINGFNKEKLSEFLKNGTSDTLQHIEKIEDKIFL